MTTVNELVPKTGDLLLIVRDGGQSVIAWQRDGDQIVRMPVKLSIDFAGEIVPVNPSGAGSLLGGKLARRFSLTVGWTKAQWERVSAERDAAPTTTEGDR